MDDGLAGDLNAAWGQKCDAAPSLGINPKLFSRLDKVIIRLEFPHPR